MNRLELPVSVKTIKAVVVENDIIVLAVPYSAVPEVTAEIKEIAANKIIIDATNPFEISPEGYVISPLGPTITAGSRMATLLPKSLAGVFDGGRCTVTPDFDAAIEGADVVMALRIQQERQASGLIPSLREYIRGYQVNASRLSRAQAGALVMHPGPKNEGIELAPEVAEGINAVIEEQVTNGVAVRMALLVLMARGRGR